MNVPDASSPLELRDLSVSSSTDNDTILALPSRPGSAMRGNQPTARLTETFDDDFLVSGNCSSFALERCVFFLVFPALEVRGVS
jgi:hypothetical protein